jgi:hypothetical protein
VSTCEKSKSDIGSPEDQITAVTGSKPSHCKNIKEMLHRVKVNAQHVKPELIRSKKHTLYAICNANVHKVLGITANYHYIKQ